LVSEVVRIASTKGDDARNSASFLNELPFSSCSRGRYVAEVAPWAAGPPRAAPIDASSIQLRAIKVFCYL
jgi:hypothetical protein